MCNCRSYNRPDLGGSDPEVILTLPDFFQSSKDPPTICVDKCMVPHVKKLWEHEIITRGCCCGHNGQFGPPDIFVENKESAEKARKLLPDYIDILYYENNESTYSVRI